MECNFLVSVQRSSLALRIVLDCRILFLACKLNEDLRRLDRGLQCTDCDHIVDMKQTA